MKIMGLFLPAKFHSKMTIKNGVFGGDFLKYFVPNYSKYGGNPGIEITVKPL